MPLNLLNFMYELGLLLFALLLLIYFLVLIMHFAIPGKLLKIYFKQPYFKPEEIAIFSGFPLGFIRTIIFMRVLSFPKSGTKRGLTKAYKIVPSWLCVTSRIILTTFIVTFGLLVTILLVFFVESLVFPSTSGLSR